MPKVALPVTNHNEFQTRQIGYSIANDIMKEMRFNQDAPIFLTNDDGDIIQQGTKLERHQYNDNVRLAENKNRLTVTVETGILEDMGLTFPTKLYTNWNRPIFADRKLDIFLTPIYVPSKMTINFKFDFMSEGQGKKWVREIIRRVGEGRQDQTHRIKYTYLIPKEITFMLHEFYKLRENVAGYGDDFAAWLDANMDGRFTTITNIVGNVQTAQLAMPEVQQEVHGYFEGPFETKQVAKENPSNMYRIEFDYVIHFEDVMDLVLDYPIMIHNQVLEEGKLRDDPMKQIRYTDPSRGSMPNQWMNYLTFFIDPRQEHSQLEHVPGYNIPRYDEFEFVTDPINEYFEHYFSVLIEVDPDDVRAAFSIQDLEDSEESLTFSDRWKAFLEQEMPFMNLNDGSVLHVRHYPTLNKAYFNKVVCDPNTLSFRSNVDMSLRTINHFSFFICTDLRKINLSGLKRLLCWPDVLRDIFIIQRRNVTIPEPLNGACLTLNQLSDVFEEAYGERLMGYNMKTVGNARFTTYRR